MRDATSDRPAAVPRRFRPRALPTLAMLAAVAVFVAAGHWQQRRMEEKQALQAQRDATEHAAAIPLATLPAGADWSALRYRPVVATGIYDARRQILIDNRVHAGRAGFAVVTPLALVDGRTVLVERGWVAQGASRAELPAVAPPSGEVTVHGRIDLPAAGYFELGREATTGPIRQNLDPARFSEATGVAVLPVIVRQTEAPPDTDGLVRDWKAPDAGIDKHRIYMMQWYAFAGLAVVLWLVLGRRAPVAGGDG